MAIAKQKSGPKGPPGTHQPYVADNVQMPELTWSAVLLGTVLGILFGFSSLYLVLRVGLTVSASIPVAVLSITIFRLFSRIFRVRRATILENNIVQTAGSAGESIAFGVAVTIPALMLLGFEMETIRVMTVSVLGGLLGILMMIPLRRAFIVRQHGKLTYPEGTACADVLIVGEEGGSTAKTVFAGFGLGMLYKFAIKPLKLFKEMPEQALETANGGGLKGAVLGGDVSPELLGVGYIIGPKIASVMLAGGVLAYLVLAPLIVMFSGSQTKPLEPATKLVSQMSPDDLRNEYILYIGAGAVTTGGLISMFQALPMIFSSITAGLRDLRRAKEGEQAGKGVPRTERDLPLWLVLVGSLGLILTLMAVKPLGLDFSFHGAVGAVLIVLFGFLFVTVSARLTGEIGSSSNPISGMTVATLLFTCLVFVLLGKTEKPYTLTALTIASIVCIASSNGGTTAQDLKTGFLVGGTPRSQQLAILVGALTSALVIGMSLVLLNSAYTIYSKNPEVLPHYRVPDVASLKEHEQAGGEYAGKDTTMYRVLNVGQGEIAGVPQGKYLVDDQGNIRYLVDPAINGRLTRRDDGTPVDRFQAPKTRLMAIIIDGIMNQKLPWGLVMIGVLIAVALELSGVPALPFAVGVYLPIQVSMPIFVGGLVRWAVDKISKRPAHEAEMSPGVLLASGYIAGGAIGGASIAFMEFAYMKFPDLRNMLDLSQKLGEGWNSSNWPAITAFGMIALVLMLVGLGKFLGGDGADDKPVEPPKSEPPKKKLEIG